MKDVQEFCPLHWVVSAKRIETRQKRISEIAENANKNLKPKQFR